MYISEQCKSLAQYMYTSFITHVCAYLTSLFTPFTISAQLGLDSTTKTRRWRMFPTRNATPTIFSKCKQFTFSRLSLFLVIKYNFVLHQFSSSWVFSFGFSGVHCSKIFDRLVASSPSHGLRWKSKQEVHVADHPFQVPCHRSTDGKF